MRIHCFVVRLHFALILASALVCLGCQPGSSRFVGYWEGQIQTSKLDKDRKEIPTPIFNTLTLVKLTLREEGTFEIILQGRPYQGGWSATGDSAELRVTRLLEKPLETEFEPIPIQWVSKDEIRLSGPVKVELKRATKPAWQH